MDESTKQLICSFACLLASRVAASIAAPNSEDVAARSSRETNRLLKSRVARALFVKQYNRQTCSLGVWASDVSSHARISRDGDIEIKVIDVFALSQNVYDMQVSSDKGFLQRFS